MIAVISTSKFPRVSQLCRLFLVTNEITMEKCVVTSLRGSHNRQIKKVTKANQTSVFDRFCVCIIQNKRGNFVDRFCECIIPNKRGNLVEIVTFGPLDLSNRIVSTTFPHYFFRLHNARVKSVKHTGLGRFLLLS